MKRVLTAVALLFAGTANAAIVTSTADPKLAGATVETFNTVAPGDYTTLSLSKVTVKGNGAPMTIGTTNAEYGVDNSNNLQNTSATPSSFDLVFSNVVTAFGIFGGAVNNAWTYSAYDASGNLVESINTSGLCCSAMFFGIANDSGFSRVTLEGFGDWAIFDNLHFVEKSGTDVPEPGALALLGLGVLGIAASRRRRA
jgi:hypothetical protein